MNLKQLLAELRITQRAVAQAAGVSDATLAQIANHGQWPKSIDRRELQGRIAAALQARGAAAADIAAALDPVPNPSPALPLSGKGDGKGLEPSPSEEDTLMLLRKQSLSPEARKQFKLFRDPFSEPASAEEVYLTPDIRYAREALWHAACHGGFLAIVGESGSGKSTLRRDLHDRIRRENKPVLVVEPYVMGMEENDKKGQTLKSGSIAEAVIATLAEGEPLRRSQDAKYRQLHRVLRDSHRGGNRHLLLIEEAHALPKPTLKHLKRFHELEDGFQRLLSVCLIGQPELSARLSESDPEVREVVQRCEPVTLAPLADAEGYLRFRLNHAGAKLEDLIDGAGLAALVERLTPLVQRGRQASRISLLYPLALQNLFVACLNKAAEVGFDRVDGDVVRGV